jgi:hypothetical protein
MELDLQSLFGLHDTWCVQLFSLALVSKYRRHLVVTPWLRPSQLPPSPPPPHLLSYTRALLVSQDYTFSGWRLISWERSDTVGRKILRKSGSFGENGIRRTGPCSSVCLYSLAWVKECGTTARPFEVSMWISCQTTTTITLPSSYKASYKR